MKVSDDDLRSALRAAAPVARADRTGCPSSEALARAAEGGPTGAAPAIVDHLAGCADCALEYRVASALKPWAEGAAASLDMRRRRSGTRVLPLALPASLAACLALVGWVVALHQREGRLEARLAEARPLTIPAAPGLAAAPAPSVAPAEPQPIPNVPLVDLFPRGATRGSGTSAPVLDAGASSLVVLILNVREPQAGATYAIEIVDARGQRAWSTENVRAGGDPLTLAVPSRLLTDESYQVHLYRLRAGRRVPDEQYDFRLRRRPEGQR
jgi:hypothetical protein